MRNIRFIHAADLHLDAPFSGIAGTLPQTLSTLLQQATFTAFTRLITLCEQEKPDFLLLSGDILNEEDGSLRARLSVRDGCARLTRQGIRVFMIHGNHDPLSSALRAVRWPEGMVVFGSEARSVPLFDPGETRPFAVIHGISHAALNETRNLADLLGQERLKDSLPDCAHIALLHATPGGGSGTPYAPFSLDDLRRGRMDYWALGHIHDRRIISEAPFAVYSGCTQGLHINESGPKGCLLATLSRPGETWQVTTAFKPLGPVQWETVQATIPQELEESDDLEALEEILRQAMHEAAESDCDAMILRLQLSGRTALNTLLRTPASQADLLERLREQGLQENPQQWIKDLEITTAPLLERTALLNRDDLLGEIFRQGEQLRSGDLSVIQDTVLAPLYGHRRAGKVLPPLSEEELQRLLDDAESLCAGLLGDA